ncbi:hypothetical protein WG66_014062, partial [Moniliophthora roreri]
LHWQILPDLLLKPSLFFTQHFDSEVEDTRPQAVTTSSSAQIRHPNRPENLQNGKKVSTPDRPDSRRHSKYSRNFVCGCAQKPRRVYIQRPFSSCISHRASRIDDRMQSVLPSFLPQISQGLICFR